MNRRAFAVAVALFSTLLLAQETPTELEAARPILTERAQLEASLNIPALVAQVTADNLIRDKVVARARQLMETELLAMGDDITRHPEIGFEETRSVKIETEYLAKHGFTIEMPVAGLATAFVARFHGAAGSPGTASPQMGSSSNTTPCAALTARSTATSTPPKARSAWPPPSLWPSSYKPPTPPATFSSTARLPRR